MGEGGSHVVDAETPYEQLGELGGALEHGMRDAEQLRVQLTDDADARRRRGDDRVEPGERVDEPPRQHRGVGLIAGVEMHLAAAGLLRRELNLVAEPLEDPARRADRIREHRVGDAGREQRYPHVRAAVTRSLDIGSPV